MDSVNLMPVQIPYSVEPTTSEYSWEPTPIPFGDLPDKPPIDSGILLPSSTPAPNTYIVKGKGLSNDEKMAVCNACLEF